MDSRNLRHSVFDNFQRRYSLTTRDTMYRVARILPRQAVEANLSRCASPQTLAQRLVTSVLAVEADLDRYRQAPVRVSLTLVHSLAPRGLKLGVNGLRTARKCRCFSVISISDFLPFFLLSFDSSKAVSGRVFLHGARVG